MAPENTLQAIVAAKKTGCKAVEFDVQNTADGSLVLCHDEFLGRVIAGRGRVCELTSEQWKTLCVTNPARPWEPAAPVCFFDEAMRLCEELDLAMNVELKPARGQAERLARLASDRMVRRTFKVPVLVSSFHAGCLERFAALCPQLPRGFLFESASLNWLEVAKSLNVQTVHPAKELATPQMIEAAHAHGFEVMVWTVDDAQQAAQLRRNGAEAICTTCPQRF